MAGNKYIRTAKKLQTACNKQFGVKLLIDQRQWYPKDKDMAITVYTLYQAMPNDKKSTTKIQLFQTYSQIQLVLFMRDFWYELNGWEIPHDNETWEELKKQYGERKEPTAQDPETSTENRNTERQANPNRTAVCDELYTGWQRNRSSTHDS